MIPSRRYIALDLKLASVLKRNDAPKDNVERIRLAKRAYEKSLNAASAEFMTEALLERSETR